MENIDLNAVPRPGVGKGIARKARKAGLTPAVLYRAGGSATPVSFRVAELATIFRKTADPNTLVNVKVEGGAAHLCLVREIQRDPVSRDVIHVDFYEVQKDQPVTVDVAVNPVGRAAGTRAGGTLRLLARSVRVECAAARIPKTIDVDVTPLEVGQFLKVSQVPRPDGVKILFQQDYNIVAVEGKRAAVEEVAAPAAEGAAAAPAAAAAPGKPAEKAKK
ncbi:MAG: 50S ribosomal protein L25 [Myxococcota bacterium]